MPSSRYKRSEPSSFVPEVQAFCHFKIIFVSAAPFVPFYYATCSSLLVFCVYLLEIRFFSTECSIPLGFTMK
ncbi:hypothetical protein D918_09990 [Trichuris suis]|nr:hypothetical protein D918_09990 [Trichuris suis]